MNSTILRMHQKGERLTPPPLVFSPVGLPMTTKSGILSLSTLRRSSLLRVAGALQAPFRSGGGLGTLGGGPPCQALVGKHGGGLDGTVHADEAPAAAADDDDDGKSTATRARARGPTTRMRTKTTTTIATTTTTRTTSENRARAFPPAAPYARCLYQDPGEVDSTITGKGFYFDERS